jgi:predicted enzyme related to lactoylglutathione lyase
VRLSLDHAHVFASDSSATVNFFRTMFDAEVVWDGTAAGVRGIRLRIGAAFLMVYDQPPKGPRGGAFHHVGIATDDLPALMQRMRERGYVFRNAMRTAETFDYVMIAGPDDLLIELFQSHEPSAWRLPWAGTDAGSRTG